jgi:hypothetical protein
MLHNEVAQSWLNQYSRVTLSTESALTFFDTLEAVALKDLLGFWKGAELKTNHPFNGLLKSLGWYGKAFITPDAVHPLIFKQTNSEYYSLNTKLIPQSLLKRIPKERSLTYLKPLYLKTGPLLKTMKPGARMRMMEYRGVSSATMIYDFLPINDVFRKIDNDTVMGLMDMKELSQPFFFILKKQKVPGKFYENLIRYNLSRVMT